MPINYDQEYPKRQREISYLTHELEKMKVREAKLVRLVAAFRSAIHCGENWSEELEQMYNEAMLEE